MWNALAGAVKGVLAIYWPTWKEDVLSWWESVANAIHDLLTWVANKIRSAYDEANKIINDAEKTAKIIGDVVRFVSVTDAVITPSGQVIKTDPSDYLFATKNPENLGAGGGVTFDFSGMTITALDADEVKKKLDELISDTMSKYS